MEKNKKIDRRVIKTKKAIHKAFVSLISKKNINSITIKEIAQTADINRKTFYNYYDSIYTVMDEIENEIVNRFDEVLSRIDLKQGLENPKIIFESLNKIIENDFDVCKNLMREKRHITLISKSVDLMKKKTVKMLSEQIDIDEKSLQVFADYTMSGMLAVYQNWFNSDKSVPLSKLSDDLGFIVFNGINGIIKVRK